MGKPTATHYKIDKLLKLLHSLVGSAANLALKGSKVTGLILLP